MPIIIGNNLYSEGDFNMKIAIPVDDKVMDSKISKTFGRANYFLIYNLDKKDNVFLDNLGASSQGGAGIKAAQMIVDSNVTALISPSCGENAAVVINGANIQIFNTINDVISDNIDAFTEGKLVPLEEFHHHK